MDESLVHVHLATDQNDPNNVAQVLCDDWLHLTREYAEAVERSPRDLTREQEDAIRTYVLSQRKVLTAR
jgi:hypothetical protein